MKTIANIFQDHQGLLANKYPHHLEAYDQFFNRFQGQDDIGILEIGVSQGGSLEIWREYFGPSARVYGIDVQDVSYINEIVDAKIFIGNQNNPGFLNEVLKEVMPLHIIIDDGSHNVRDQKIAFETLFPALANNGIYAVEDIHTSYREAYGGGLRNKHSFIEQIKNMIDGLHQNEIPEENFYGVGMNIFSVHVYPSLAIIEKKHSYEYGGPTMRGHDA